MGKWHQCFSPSTVAVVVVVSFGSDGFPYSRLFISVLFRYFYISLCDKSFTLELSAQLNEETLTASFSCCISEIIQCAQHERRSWALVSSRRWFIWGDVQRRQHIPSFRTEHQNSSVLLRKPRRSGFSVGLRELLH